MFEFTKAVAPVSLSFCPESGYLHDTYYDVLTRTKIPVIMAAASCDQIIDLFFDLLDPVGSEVDVVLESKHHGDIVEFWRHAIDLPVLKSVLYDFEDILLNDGDMGISVLNADILVEIQFDDHKMFIIYGEDLKPFMDVFSQHSIECREGMQFVTNFEHTHFSGSNFAKKFDELKEQIGAEE